jgi:pimeloyl-ACP methyl ester carboxylesterase
MGTAHQVSTDDGTNLAVTDHGGSGTPILILHGLAGSGREMERTARALNPHRVLTLDSRGHGESTRRPTSVSRQAHINDVVCVIESVVGSPVILIGQSMGGNTALLVAAARPDLVDRLVLLEAGVGGDGTKESRERMRNFFESWPRPFADRLRAEDFLGHSAIAQAWIADLEERGDGLWPRFDADVRVVTIAHVDAIDRWDEWSAFRALALVVFGKDGMFSELDKDALVAGAHDISRVDLNAGSHDAHLDALPSWFDALNEFLGK